MYIELWKRKLVGGYKSVSHASRLQQLRTLDVNSTEILFNSLLEQYDARKEGIRGTGGKGGKGVGSQTIGKLSGDMIQLLGKLEEKLSFEDILFFRSLAEKELSNAGSQKSWLGGVVSWAFGGYSEEEKSKFFEALKFQCTM